MRETDNEFGAMHDRWLADYHHHVTEAWCENPFCEHHENSVTVDYESEYGTSWIQPEECPICHGSLTLDRPPEPTDDAVSDEDTQP